MGSLSSLPTEVRMRIYRFALPWARHVLAPVSPMIFLSAPSPGATIFQISKAINREAMDVFYSDTVFNICLAMFTEPLKMTHHLAFPGSAFIQKVHFVGFDDSFYDANRDRLPVCRDVIRGFGGPEIPRNIFRLTLRTGGWTHFGAVAPVLFQDLATMTGFQSVVIEVRQSSRVFSRISYAKWRKQLFGGAGGLASMIVEKLAPTLGPGVVEFRQLQCRVKFQPRAHLAGKAAGTRRVIS